MKIKIECTQKEFAEIARGCMYSKIDDCEGNCYGCVFHLICQEESDQHIEDIAEFKIVKEQDNGTQKILLA